MKNIICIILVLFLSVSDIFLYRIGVLPLEPASILFPLIVLCFFEAYRTKIRWINSSLSVGFFLLILILSLLFGFVSSSNYAITAIGLHFITLVIFIISYTIAKELKKDILLRIVLVSYFILLGSVIFDLLYSSNVNRGAGFAENPNSAATRLFFIGLIVLALIQKRKSKKYFLFIWVFSIFLTLSRSSIILVFLTIILLSINNFSHIILLQNFSLRKLLKNSIGIIVFFIAFVSLVPIISNYIPGFSSPAAIKRIESITGDRSLIESKDSEGGGRLYIAEDYWELISINPFGYGTGESSNRLMLPSSAHNLYLRFGLEYGIITTLILIGYLILLLKQALNRRSFFYLIMVICFLIISFFSHIILENRTFIICLAFADALSFRESQKIRETLFK